MARNAQHLIDLAVAILGPEPIHANDRPPAGVKNAVYDSGCPPPMMPMLLSIVNGVLWSTDTVLACAEEEGLLSMEPAALPPGCPPLNPQPQELIVVLYEALLGSRRVRGTSPLVQLVQARKASLQQTLAARRKRGATNQYVAPVRLPRFVRVNTLKTTAESAKAHLASLGFAYVAPTPLAGVNTLALAPKQYTSDPLIPGLLVMPPGTNLHDDPEYARGALVLQDRASCLSALALSPPAGAACIDTCASPGNKTMHLACLMGSGRVTAFERDSARLATLQRNIARQGAAHIVEARGGDFLDADVSPTGELQ